MVCHNSTLRFSSSRFFPARYDLYIIAVAKIETFLLLLIIWEAYPKI